MHCLSSAKASHVGRRSPQKRTFVAPHAAVRPRTTSYGAADLDRDRDFVGAARLRMTTKKSQDPETLDDFVSKIKAAWRIFFPERERDLTPKDEGKKRLRMILVADRCGMSTESLEGMRLSIVRAMESYVEVSEEESVEVNLSLDPDLGTIYSVAVPVKRVRPTVRPLEEDAMLAGGRVRVRTIQSYILLMILGRRSIHDDAECACPVRLPEHVLCHVYAEPRPTAPVLHVPLPLTCPSSFFVHFSLSTPPQWDPNDPESDPSDQFPYGA
jgi:septum formation topological specificity factor MinE